jgi:hypothetical protein
MAVSTEAALVMFRTCFLPYVFAESGIAGHGLLGAIVRGCDLKFKQASPSLHMTFA